MLQMIRVFLWSTVLFYSNAVFILFPSQDKRLVDLYSRNMRVIEKACDKSQYRNPNVFTTLIVKRMPEAVAYCEKKINGFVIAFDRGHLEHILTDLDQDQVMMHELAHCLFNEPHSSDSKHFMAEYYESIPKDVYEKQVRDYLKGKCGR